MGKRQHQKDKMYLTCTEWTTLYGGKATGTSGGQDLGFRRLPIDHCRHRSFNEDSTAVDPFDHPLCSPEGHIFDLMNIIPFLKKFGVNPITGKKLDAKSLIKLNFHKNFDGKFHCPVLYKVFNNHSHIVAVKTTGNVFSYEAVEELNLKPHNFKELLTDESFTRSDLVVLQDPADLKKFNLSEFHYLKNNLKVEDEELERAKSKSTYYLKTVSAETKDILDELQREYKPKEKVATEAPRTADKFNAAHYSTGAVAAAFTSTVMVPTTTHVPAILDENIVRYGRITKKGYVRLQTNLGPLNIELHCDMVQKTCENFIKLCQKGYYNNTIFHRSIRNFMVQGGDPEGTGKGGESYWGKPFQNEIKPKLKHAGRGVVSMANSGPSTNKSQFFITYRSCKHLDGKHTVFGRLVGGQETLNAMELIATDKRDRPKEVIRIEKAIVFVDPYEEVDEQLAKDRELEEQERKKKLTEKKKPSSTATSNKSQTFKNGVGKYINPDVLNVRGAELDDVASKKPKLKDGSGFSDFSSW